MITTQDGASDRALSGGPSVTISSEVPYSACTAGFWKSGAIILLSERTTSIR
jgi:hypothetical protein